MAQHPAVLQNIDVTDSGLGVMQTWAENGASIGQLNLTPDMLSQIAGWMGANGTTQ